jgi:hypothetical protein
MTFANPTDYPDFTVPGQSGAGVIINEFALVAGTYGPFYVGNLEAIAVNCINPNNGTLTVFQQVNPVFDAGPNWGTSEYDLRAGIVLYDEIKVAAPYLFFQTAGTIQQLMFSQSSGGRGAPAQLGDNYLLQQAGFNLGAGANTSFVTSAVIPGPAICTAHCGLGGVPQVIIYDFAGGGRNGTLGYGRGPASVTNNSGVTFPFCAGNNVLQVTFINNGAADTDCNLIICSERGY